MKPNKDEPPTLLSKSNAKHLLARNASQASLLTKQALWFDKEKRSEERSFLKKREHILQRHSKICELQRSDSSCSSRSSSSSLQSRDKKKWKSETTLFATQDTVNSEKRSRAHDQSTLFTDTTSMSRSKKNTYKGSVSAILPPISLPSIHAQDNSRRKRRNEKKKPLEMVCDGDVCKISYGTVPWPDLRECRYLRSSWNYEKEECT